MTAVYIIGGILAFFFAVGMIKAGVIISYAEEFGLTVTVCGLHFVILPGGCRSVRLRDYTPEALAKRRAKEEKKAAKKAAKKAKKAAKKAASKKKEAEAIKAGRKKKEKIDLSELIPLITAVVKTAITRFGKALRIRAYRIHVGVAAGDAAKTALLYGAVSQSACYLAALLDAASTLEKPQKSDVYIYPDFISEKPVIDIEIGITLRVWQVFDLVFRSAGSAIKQLIKNKI